MVEKKDSYQYSEKFSHLRVAPSVKGFGGRPLEGCLIVSATGMVGVIVLARDLNQMTLQSVSESLGTMRNRITTADICYGKSKHAINYFTCHLMNHFAFLFLDGHFLVAVSSGNVKLPIQCYRVSVKKVDDKCIITSQALPSFFLQNIPVKETTCMCTILLSLYLKEIQLKCLFLDSIKNRSKSDGLKICRTGRYRFASGGRKRGIGKPRRNMGT